MRLTRAALIAVLALAILPAAAHADPPSYTTTSATPGATTATVTVSGTITPGEVSVSYWVRWDLDGTLFCGDGGNSTKPSDFVPSPLPQLSASDTAQTVSVTMPLMPGLMPGQNYCAELVVENNSTNQVIDNDLVQTPPSFTEPELPPTIGAPTSSPASPTSESVGVTIDPNDLSVSDSFLYDLATSAWCTSNGASGSPAFQVSQPPASTGGMAVQVSATLSDLTPGQTYCWGVEATNSVGSITSFTGTFLAGLPLASTSPATAVSDTSATLNAVVDPEGNATDYTFDYAPSSDPFCSGGTGNPSATGVVPVGAADTSDYSVSAAITGLAPATTYCFEVAVANAVGVTLGGLLTFTTAGNPLGGAAGGGGAGAGGAGAGGNGGGGSSAGIPGPGSSAPSAKTPKPSCSISNTSATVILKKPRKGKPRTPLDSIVVTLRCTQTSSATLTGSIRARVKHRTTTFRLAARRLSLHARAGKAVTIRLPGGALAVIAAKATLTARLKLTARDTGGTGMANRSFKLHG